VGGGPVVRRATVVGGVGCCVLVAGCLAVGVPLMDKLFDGEALLLVGLLVGLVGYFVEFLARGTLAGNGRFRSYGLVLALDGVARLVGCAALAVLGVATAGPYGIVVGAAPLVATGIAMRGQRGRAGAGPEPDPHELSTALGWLLAASVLAQSLVNAGPLAVKLLATDAEKTIAGTFLAGLIVARIPLFLFQAIQASALPKLSRLAAAGEPHDFQTALRRLLLLVGTLGLAGTCGALVLGPWVVTLLFGPEFRLAARDMTVLAAATAAYMLAMTMAQALIALAGYARVALGWLAGVVAFAVVTALGSDLLTRVETGLLAGSVTAAVAMAALLVPLLRRRRLTVDPEPVAPAPPPVL
jgi:O-antigen/teichoic acid export membrane protein